MSEDAVEKGHPVVSPLSPNRIPQFDPADMKKMQRISLIFGCGHVLNDLCAASWFSYMLIFFERVAELSNAQAGGLVLLGQLADGLWTPVVGIGCDASASKADPTIPGEAVRKRLPWHLAGSVLVMFAFPPLFIEDAQYTFGKGTLQVLVWYGIAVTLFQVGWATVQISHLSLIPDLSAGIESRKTSLNATRYAATVLATVSVYSGAWLLLGTASDGGSGSDGGDQLSRADHSQFMKLTATIVFPGIFFSIILFHLGMRYSLARSGELMANPASPQSTAAPAKTKEAISMWLCTRKFYFVGYMYMCTRLLVNITQTYLALYLLDSLHMEKTAIATAPLVLYASSLLGTLAIGKVVKRIGAGFAYFLATAGCLLAAFIMYSIPDHLHNLVYAAAAVFGVSSSLLMVSCLSIVASLISDLPGSAFVYGAFSFTDKLSSGAVIMIIQSIDAENKAEYYRTVVGLVPAIVALNAVVGVVCCLYSKNPSTWDEYVATRDAPAAAETRAINDGPYEAAHHPSEAVVETITLVTHSLTEKPAPPMVETDRPRSRSYGTYTG
ncbi:hypothetical protein DIPPA_30070 [Diplonema papillatum]|nr:hypothetical protein DIPPA_30070 [Diplonema papillatum]